MVGARSKQHDKVKGQWWLLWLFHSRRHCWHYLKRSRTTSSKVAAVSTQRSRFKGFIELLVIRHSRHVFVEMSRVELGPVFLTRVYPSALSWADWITDPNLESRITTPWLTSSSEGGGRLILYSSDWETERAADTQFAVKCSHTCTNAHGSRCERSLQFAHSQSNFIYKIEAQSSFQ